MDKQSKRGYRGKRVVSSAEICDDSMEIRKTDTETDSGKHGFWHDYGHLLITVAVVFVLFKVIFQIAFVPTGSMETTIPTNSLLIAWRLPYLVSDPAMERGDVAIFWDEEMGKILVKRVVGLGGEDVSFAGGYTRINDEKIQEDYLPLQGITEGDKVFHVPEDSLFMMGDNRTGSWDSRLLAQPYIPLDAVQGKALICIPMKQISLFKSESFSGINFYLPQFGQTHTL